MSDSISTGSRLALHMTIHDEHGTVLEETDGVTPFECVVGENELPPGVERELLGKARGHAFDLLLEVEDAFGPHDPSQVVSIPRAELPPGEEVSPGDLIPMLLEPEEGEDGEEEEVELPVVAVDEESVTVDLNHPYSGQRLRFSGEVVSVD